MNAADRRELAEARRLLEAGKVREALGRLMRLTEKHPEDADVRSGVARSLLTRGEETARKRDFDRAFIDFEQSLKYDDRPEAHVHLGRIHQIRGRLDEAFSELTRAVDLDEALPDAHEALGHYFLQIRDVDQASAAFGRAIAQGIERPSAWLGLWEAYIGAGRYDQAHETALDAAGRWPDNDGVLNVAGLSFAVARNDTRSAIEWWNKAVARNPANLPVLFNLAGVAGMEGRRTEALGFLRRCMAVDGPQTVALWRADLQAPQRKFAAYAGDEDFLDVLGLIK